MHQHKYAPSQYPDYEKCEVCHSLHNLAPAAPDKVYEGGVYWTANEGKPTLQEQCHNIAVHQEKGLTKNDFILNHMPEYSETVLEIGCAPGITMKEILDKGRAKQTFGVEVDKSYEQEMLSIIGHEDKFPALLFGYFPEATSFLGDHFCDVILGIDVFEHSFEPEAFLKECSRLLNNKGTLFLMLPMASDSGEVPARSLHREHVNLFTQSAMKEMLFKAGFEYVSFDEWHEIHQSVLAVKR